MVFADYGVSLPVTNSLSVVGYSWAFFNTNPVGYTGSVVGRTIPFSVRLFLVSQVLIERKQVSGLES